MRQIRISGAGWCSCGIGAMCTTSFCKQADASSVRFPFRRAMVSLGVFHRLGRFDSSPMRLRRRTGRCPLQTSLSSRQGMIHSLRKTSFHRIPEGANDLRPSPSPAGALGEEETVRLKQSAPKNHRASRSAPKNHRASRSAPKNHRASKPARKIHRASKPARKNHRAGPAPAPILPLRVMCTVF